MACPTWGEWAGEWGEAWGVAANGGNKDPHRRANEPELSTERRQHPDSIVVGALARLLMLSVVICRTRGCTEMMTSSR